jgi:hypothetical protein
MPFLNQRAQQNLKRNKVTKMSFGGHFCWNEFSVTLARPYTSYRRPTLRTGLEIFSIRDVSEGAAGPSKSGISRMRWRGRGRRNRPSTRILAADDSDWSTRGREIEADCHFPESGIFHRIRAETGGKKCKSTLVSFVSEGFLSCLQRRDVCWMPGLSRKYPGWCCRTLTPSGIQAVGRLLRCACTPAETAGIS